MAKIKLGDVEINYRIIISNRKTISLIIDPEKGLLVRAPERVTYRQIEQIVREKSNWIIRKQEEIKRIRSEVEKEFVAGEKLPFQGEIYEIEVMESGEIKSVTVSLEDGIFLIKVPHDLKGDNR